MFDSSKSLLKFPQPHKKNSPFPISFIYLENLIHYRVFIVSTININNGMFEADLFFLYTNDSCLLNQYTISKKLVENLNKKL